VELEINLLQLKLILDENMCKSVKSLKISYNEELIDLKLFKSLQSLSL